MYHEYVINLYNVIQLLKNEIVKFSGKMKELEKNISNKMTHTSKDKYCIFSFMYKCLILSFRYTYLNQNNHND